MAPPFAGGLAITVIRPGGVDKFGDPDGSPETTHVVAGCAVVPRGSSESDNRGTTVITGLTLYAPYGADIGPADVILLPSGLRYTVQGEVGRWKNWHTGREAGLEVALQRVTG